MKATMKFASLLAAALIALSAHAQHHRHSSEQVNFSAEEEAVHSPVRIPDDAWAILKEDSDIKSILESENLSADQLPRTWFSAAVVHLHSNDENDLVVEGEQDARGANISPFWVFLSTPHGMKLVMNPSTHDLTIHHARWHGYRLIEMTAMTCCEVFTTWLRYENGAYRDYRHYTN